MKPLESHTPEERLANRVLERFSLAPPIDVESLASRYADVAYVRFPIDADGITIGLKRPNKLPKIRVNIDTSRRRKRFTLAHELGHVLIPWHTGTIVDLLGNENANEDSKYWEMEAEANRFAASLLMPDFWVMSLFSASAKIDEVVKEISEQADVSIDAAIIKVLKLGPKGFLLAKSKFGVVQWSNTTQGTNVNRLLENSPVPEKPDFPFEYYSVIDSSTAEYHWWKISNEVSIGKKPDREWRQILSEIIDETCLGNHLKVKQSINGIISAANGSVRETKSLETVYSRVLQRLANRSDSNEDVGRAIAHPNFQEFLVARIYAFFE